MSSLPYGFPGAEKLLRENVFLFVVDEDNDLSTLETFPTGVQVRVKITDSIVSVNGTRLQGAGLASATVGEDVVTPEVSLGPPPESQASITPSLGSTDVDTRQPIRMEFTEPIQPLTLSTLFGQSVPTLQSAVQIRFGPSSSPVQMPFSIEIPSVYDLTSYVLRPAYDFPGRGPLDDPCSTYARIDLQVFASQLEDLNANTNLLGTSSFYFTGAGVGVVNAPVAPDTIYIARAGGGEPALSIVDLNGFGGGTGSPEYDPAQPLSPGNSNYPNNPNQANGSLLTPPIRPGTCTFDGGSQGVFTLTRSSTLNDRLVQRPVVESVTDMAIGHALDTTFNNGPPPFGCQSGGGNSCASTGLKNVNPVLNGNNTLAPLQQGQFGAAAPGGENIISWAVHPNPPPLIFPPLCLSPYIGGQEPTSVDTQAAGVLNVLTPGAFPLGVFNVNGTGSSLPPSNLLVQEQNTWFEGPSSAAAAATNSCRNYQMRQQIGHFLYLCDRIRGEVVVLNSNRMTVVDRIDVPDPTAFAMSPNLDLLAVTNQSAGVVSFIDINPTSPNFHQVVRETLVGLKPRGIAWQPENEDILVCNEGENSVSVISAFSLEVRKVLKNQLGSPFDVVCTARQSGFGFNRGVYFAYILNSDGSVSIFESGPNGPGGWGFDEIIFKTPYRFNNPKAIQPDHINLASGVWIVHQGKMNPDGSLVPNTLNEGAVSNFVLTSGVPNPIPLSSNPGAASQRGMEWSITRSIGGDVLTGVPSDIAFDNQMNLGGLPNFSSPQFSSGSPAIINGKGLVKQGGVNSNEPRHMFLAIQQSSEGGGVVDVIDINTGARVDTNPFLDGTQSIPASGVTMVMDYWRQ
jgi:hypothetical protein